MLRQEIPEQLIADVKTHVQITWEDQATEDRLRGLIASASIYLDSKGGAALDYDTDGLPRLLLMECVRYLRDDAMDVFETNYRALILAMQNERLVKQYVDSTASEESTGHAGV